ncbi:MAG TPA: glycosyltransferase [Ignavibacteria bacterium]|nr:glycosyltransferase [Ignavibacteria bacterium]
MRLLKFDTINPELYLTKKINENIKLIEEMNRQEFLDWSISLRSNFSDFYSYNLNKLGWEAEEFFVNDHYIDKVADDLYGKYKKLRFLKESAFNKLIPVRDRTKLNIILDYVKKYKPDVIFVREISGLPSSLWKSFSDKTLIVNRIATIVPKQWSLRDWDLIFTSTNTYKNFFELNHIDSYINSNGFEERVLKEMINADKKYEVTFVGSMSKKLWNERVKIAEYISDKVDFKWWGMKNADETSRSSINKAYQGITSGLEMFQIYKQSKIVFNDYPAMSEGAGVNQRMFEVMGTGSLLLTKDAENIRNNFPGDVFVTFRDEKDCLDKIKYYLKNEKEREEIALAGQKFILENYSYEKLMIEVDKVLRESYRKKFNK